MFTLPRLTARLAAVAAFSALLAAACNTDSTGPSSPTKAALAANRALSLATVAASTGFAVLANAAVTCTNGTILGDVGTFQATPTGKVTLTTCPVTGAVHVGDAVAKAAFNAFLAAYTALAPKTGDCDAAHTLLSTIPASVTLAPGVYCTGAALTATDVTLTLNAAGNANAAWTFKIGNLTGALTGTNFTVALANGASACNVTWWVSQAVTTTTSAFKGNILAGAAITLGGSLNGNAWSKADVTTTTTALTGCASVGGGGKGDGDEDKGEKDGDDDHGDRGHHDRDKHHDKDNDRDKHHDKDSDREKHHDGGGERDS
jgi:hypothetical protein